MANGDGVVGLAGPRADGSVVDQFRFGKSLEQVISQGHGRFYEATSRNMVLHLNSGAVTVAAANVTGAALGTLAFICGFYNPPDSGVNAEVLVAKGSTVSGTPGGPLLYNFTVPAGRISSTPTGTFRSGYLANQQAASTPLVPLVNVVLATIPADTTTVGLEIGEMGGPAAIAAGVGNYSVIDEIAGSIVVPPGTAFGIVAKAAGTSHIVHAQLVVQVTPRV
jgi:hypothetical protein